MYAVSAASICHHDAIRESRKCKILQSNTEISEIPNVIPPRVVLESASNTLSSHLPVLDAANERGILNATTAVRQAGDGSVVAEALELVLHRLRQNRALDVRVLRSLGGELGIEVSRVKRISL